MKLVSDKLEWLSKNPVQKLQFHPVFAIIFPDLDLLNGPATYHRIIESDQLLDFEIYFSNDILLVLNQDYTLPDSSRLYWTETKQGNNPYGTWTEDGAIEYTCACIENDGVIQARICRLIAHHFGLPNIQPASKSFDLRRIPLSHDRAPAIAVAAG